MDEQVLHTLNGLVTHHKSFRELVAMYVVAAPYLICFMVGVVFLLGKRPSRRGAVLAGISAVTAVAISQIVTMLVDRARPFVADPLVSVFVHHGPDRSFPSDSATAAFAIASALMIYSPRMGRIALVLAAAWGLGRIAVGMHYPTDILAGAALGAIVTMLLQTNAPRVAINWLADSLARVIPFRNGRFLSRDTE